MDKGYTTLVLDKGYVKLVDYMGNDLSPIESARMSTDNPTGVDERKDDKLREFLWKNNHSSPFESLILTVEMKLPIFVLREFDRHRSIDIDNTVIEGQSDFRKYNSRNEFSGRYAEMPAECYVPDRSRLQPQSSANKQGSSGELNESVKNIFLEDIKNSANRFPPPPGANA
jgi:thymidylate synthase (FAD)